MLEAMAVAEIAQCTAEAVPLVNILANKSAFRPFLYWREKDVLLTTAGVVPLRRSNSEIDIRRLLLLFVLLQLHRRTHISFNLESHGKISKTGWREALTAGGVTTKTTKQKAR